MYYILLLLLSILPVSIIGYYFYKIDKTKEPLSFLFKLFLGGTGSVVIVLVLTAIIGLFIPIMHSDPLDLNLIQLLIYVFIGVAMVEEVAKWFMSYIIAYNNKLFDEYYDIILYCVFVALGFACVENVFYVLSEGLQTGLIRCISAVPAHTCDGVFMGYYMGLAKINHVNKRFDYEKKNLFLSILVPTVLHGVYDYCAFANNYLFIMLFFAFVIWLYIHTFKQIKKIKNLNGKIIYKNNYCPFCGTKVNSNYCPICGNKNE